MEIGVVFPRDGLGSDRAAFRDFAQTAEALGFRYFHHGDHVVSSIEEHPMSGEDAGRPLIEAFTLFAHLGALAPSMGCVSAIMILPQRQAVLAAKQAASVDVLLGGKLRLGVAVGWSSVEYDVLNEDFHDRGRRMDEQVEVMQALWTQRSASFHGRYHNVEGVGINPLPIQRPIPIWMGGYAEPALRRIAKYASGWFPQAAPDQRTAPTPSQGAETLQRIYAYMKEFGRLPSGMGVNPGLALRSGTPDDWRRHIEDWAAVGATHISVNTTPPEGPSLAGHIAAMRRFKESGVA